MTTVKYFAIARTPDDRIGQLLVLREDGRQVSQTWTGVIYASKRQALTDLERLNRSHA